MTWNLINLPAAEELALGYTPCAGFEANRVRRARANETGEIRRYLVTLFVIFGIFVGLQNAFLEHPTNGQRRLAEVNLSERKAECRDCPVTFSSGDPASGEF